MRRWFAVVTLSSLVGVRATAQTPPIWRLERAAAIRPAEGTPAVIGNVRGIAVTNAGLVYVAERNPARVALYDAKGDFVRVVVREGSGPKEAQDPEITLQGDTLVMYDPHAMRLSRIAPNGRLLDERLLTVNAIVYGIWATADGHIILEDPGSGPGYNDGALRVAANGRQDTIRWLHPRQEDRSMQWRGPSWIIQGAPFSPNGVAVFDPAGRLVIGGSRRSRWVVISGRDTVQTVTLPDHDIAIQPAIRDSVWQAWRAKLPVTLPDIDKIVREDLIPTTLPPWVTFDISPRSDWWIGRPGGNGQLARWDVVRNGRIAARVDCPAPLLEIQRGVYGTSFGTDFVALLHEDENAVPWIGVYRIVRTQR